MRGPSRQIGIAVENLSENPVVDTAGRTTQNRLTVVQRVFGEVLRDAREGPAMPGSYSRNSLRCREQSTKEQAAVGLGCDGRS